MKKQTYILNMAKQPKKTKRGMGFQASSLSTSSPISTSGKNYLFSIAIDKYQNFPQLHNCVKDAKDIVSLLTTKYQFDKKYVTTLYNEEATTDNIFQKFESLAKTITPKDNLVIYFAGHGEYKEVFKEGYWIPVNAKSNHTSQYIPNSEIKTMLTAIHTQHTFLIVDSCFSGSLFARGGSRGVAERVERFPSRWGLTSGRSEIVADGVSGGNSPFASSIIYLLKNNIKQLGVQELCTHVIESVVADAVQTPIGEPLAIPGHKGGQFIFRLKKDEVRDWKETQEADTINAYQSFVELYPKGKHFEEASSILYQKKEDKLWKEVKEINTVKSYMVYKKQYPNGKYIDQLLELMENLEDAKDWKIACRQNRISAYIKYKRNYPNGDHLAEADAKILALQQAKTTPTGGEPSVTDSTSTPDSLPVQESEAVGLLDVSPNNQTEYEHHSVEGGGSNLMSRLVMFGIPLLLVLVFILSKIFSKLDDKDLLSKTDPAGNTTVIDQPTTQVGKPPIAQLDTEKSSNDKTQKGKTSHSPTQANESKPSSTKATTKPETTTQNHPSKVTNKQPTTTNSTPT
ncbi:MAG TPA: caspase family protein, partial [Phaeodactylibacter sp.]|nr:caspase family protein [Phaeodactylibacter sp.]